MQLNKSVPHSKRISYSTEKSIKIMKRNKHPTLFGKKPRRTLKILNPEESESDDDSYLQKHRLAQKLAKLTQK